MGALLQFGGLIIMGVFLLAGGNLINYGKPWEFIGYMGIGFGVFGSCLLFYLASLVKVRSGVVEESIIYRNINRFFKGVRFNRT